MLGLYLKYFYVASACDKHFNEGATTLRIMTVSITAFSITTVSIGI